MNIKNAKTNKQLWEIHDEICKYIVRELDEEPEDGGPVRARHRVLGLGNNEEVNRFVNLKRLPSVDSFLRLLHAVGYRSAKIHVGKLESEEKRKARFDRNYRNSEGNK